MQLKIAKDLTGLKSVEVYVKGPGAGRESAIRALQVVDIAVTMIKMFHQSHTMDAVHQNAEDYRR